MTEYRTWPPDGTTACELVLAVPDMDCATCARRITDRLEKLDGVGKVETRIISRDVRVLFDPARAASDTIADAVRSLGYRVDEDGSPDDSTPAPRVDAWNSREAWLTYVAGVGLGLGLLLRLTGLSPLLWAGALWTIDAAGLLFIAAAIVGGLNFFGKGMRAARIVRLDMNFLMTAAIFGALGVGELVEAGSIAFLFGVAELLERYSVERARGSIEALLELAPATARIRRDGRFAIVPAGEVVPGEVARVLPGEKIPIDGWVRDGHSAVDQSAITGESIPVSKARGEYVYAGSLNREGYLEVEVAKRASDTTLAHIIHLVEEAEAARSPSERFVDRFARIYTPAVTILALLVMSAPPLLTGASFTIWFVRGLTLLVISCPCALVISTPVAVVSGITSAARNGVLIKGGVHLEALAGIRAIAFDKTGTLTAGELGVADIVLGSTEIDQQELLRLAVSVEERSEHPIAAAIRRRSHELGIEPLSDVTAFEAIPGLGARAVVQGRLHQVGRPALFGAAADPWKDALGRVSGAGLSPVCVGTDDTILGLIGVADRERDEARRVIQELRRAGIERIVMLTGDHEATARTVAARLGIDEYHAGLLPDEKVAVIRELDSDHGVAMVGDGVNDAPALAAARVGIAMGAAGSDVALETADVALMSDDLLCLPYLFRLSRQSASVIRQNIVASIGLKLGLAAGVFPGLVNLITAVLVGDMGASLAVTANALRLARIRRQASV